MSRLTERQRLVVTIAIAVLVTGGLAALIFKDRGQIHDLEDEIGGLDARIRAADIEIDRTRDREDQLLVFRAVEDRELAILPTRQKIADFHRNLSTFLASAGLKFRELPESNAVESELAKGIFVTRTALSCQGDSDSLLKFLNMMESDPRLVAVKGLKVKAAMRDRNREEGTKPIHDIEVNLETYFYNPPSTDTADQIHIPGAEARLQEQALKDAIADFQPERPDTYVLRPSASRRDPMVDPRRARQKDDPEAMRLQLDRETVVVEELEAMLRTLNEMVEQEKALIQAGDIFKADRLGKEIEVMLNEIRARVAQVESMKTVVIPELLVRWQAVKLRAEELSARRPPRDVEVSRSVSERTLEEVQGLFDEGQYTDVGSLTSAWNQYLQDKVVQPDAQAAVDRINELRTKAKILADFSILTIRVTGAIVDQNDPSRSVAVVNNRPMRTGDVVDAEDDVVVGRISAEGVEFRFRGEAIFVARERGRAANKPKRPTGSAWIRHR